MSDLPGDLNRWNHEPRVMMQALTQRDVTWKDVKSARTTDLDYTKSLREKLVRHYPTGDLTIDRRFADHASWLARLNLRAHWNTQFEQTNGPLGVAHALYVTEDAEQFEAIFLRVYARYVRESIRECRQDHQQPTILRAARFMVEVIDLACAEQTAQTGFHLHHATKDPFPFHVPVLGIPTSIGEFRAQAHAVASVIASDGLGIIGAPGRFGLADYDLVVEEENGNYVRRLEPRRKIGSVEKIEFGNPP